MVPMAMKFSFAILTLVLVGPYGPKAEARVYETFADIAEKALPGVVNIRTTQYVAGRDILLDPYQFFLKGRMPRSAANHALGSGVIINTDGYILTNYHVVQGASTIEILFSEDKNKTAAKVVGTDQKTDLALLKIAPQKNMRPLDFGDSDRLKVGDIVLAIGNPFGFAHTVTSGIISAKGRVIGQGPYDNFLQTDAPIHPGNSGGPLIDIRGRVIGINSAVSTEGPGIGFAIPINIAKDVMDDLIRHGKVIRPWLGIVGKNIVSRDEVGDSFDPSGVYGVIIENLIVDGPAHGAGLQIGDLIMAINDQKVFDINKLQKEVNHRAPHDRVKLKVYRRGKGTFYSTVLLDEVPSSNDLPKEKDLF